MRSHTARVVAGSEEDAAGCFAFTDDMACGRSAEDAILTDEEFLDAIGSSNLCNLLNYLRIVVSPISTNDKKGTINAFRNGL